MSLQSFGFFGFLLVVAAVYLHLPQRWQSAFLLAASWVFYALAMPSMLPVTIAIAVFTYLCGRGMTAREGARKTAFLRIGVAGLLAILAFFKYKRRVRVGRRLAGRRHAAGHQLLQLCGDFLLN